MKDLRQFVAGWGSLVDKYATFLLSGTGELPVFEVKIGKSIGNNKGSYYSPGSCILVGDNIIECVMTYNPLECTFPFSN
ncbi:MAG: hypothetical protein U0T33_12185 [Bacteroidales bacterium]